MKEKVVLLERKNEIATVIMNRPKFYNALSPELIEELIQVLQECEADPNVKVIVLTGAGKAFCAGGDLTYIESISNVVDGRKYIVSAGRITSTIFNLEKPVIAMVNGVAAGAGFNLALACDIVFCTTSVKFVQSFAKVGLLPDCGGTYLLPRLVGLQKAKELMFTAEPIDADKALQLGIVNRVVREEELGEVTYEFAEKLSKAAPIAISLTKKILNQSYNLTLENSLELEADLQSICLQTMDNKEGVAAFKEKRNPVFKGV
jgi:2-(1,2-epoxy-1,2-dihydrophenyl)acetyl-CoA isomerase